MRDSDFKKIKPGMELLVKGERDGDNFRCIVKGYPYCIPKGKKHIWGILTEQGFVRKCDILIAVGEGIELSSGNLMVLLEQFCWEKSVDYPSTGTDKKAQGRQRNLDGLRMDLRFSPLKILDFLKEFETEHDYELHSTREYDQWYMDELLISHVKKTIQKMEQEYCEDMKAEIIRAVYKNPEVRKRYKRTRDQSNPNRVDTLELFMRFARQYLQLARYVKDSDELTAIREGMDRSLYLLVHENLVDVAEHIRYIVEASLRESPEEGAQPDMFFLDLLEGEDLQISLCCNKMD